MPDRTMLMECYRRMVRIREFEEAALAAYRRGLIPGLVHSSIGQEAVAVGFTYPLGQRDLVSSTHRGHGHLLAKGADLERMAAELFGKQNGLCHGRGGSMHIMDVTVGILGANGIVGGGIPIATGAALGVSLRKLGLVVVSFFGDGAVNTGSFHEAVNLAAVWNLPIVFVCENNGYAESTAFTSTIRIPDLRRRAEGYGLPGHVVDGNEIRACLETAELTIDRARNGGGPSVVQANTYRWYGHHTGDTAPYRSREEVEGWKARDPIRRLASDLITSAVATEGLLAQIRSEAAAEAQSAFERAAVAPDPSLDDLFDGVYAREKGGE